MSKAAHTRRRNRQRTLRRAKALQVIHELATERQQAWLDTELPNVTARLTTELQDGYEDLRDDRAHDPLPGSWLEINEGLEGNGLERLPYFGRTSSLGRGR